MDAKQRKKELIQEYKSRKVTGGAYVITNTKTGKKLLQSEIDLNASRNRFQFSQMTGDLPPNSILRGDWGKYGPQAFTFTVLEELQKKETQTLDEFREDLAILEELWREKLGADSLY